METSEKTQKEFVDELRNEWKKLWHERIDDKIKAEGIANKDFFMLFVDRGTVIFATRDFKPPDFKEILERYQVVDLNKFVPPNPSIGGWRKFIRTTLLAKRSRNVNRKALFETDFEKKPQQLKKGGRGWLHFKMQ